MSLGHHFWPFLGVGKLSVLRTAALAARENAYVPYSHFAVGAAVRVGDRIFQGQMSKMLVTVLVTVLNAVLFLRQSARAIRSWMNCW